MSLLRFWRSRLRAAAASLSPFLITSATTRKIAPNVIVATGLSVRLVVETAPEPSTEKTITMPSVMLVISAPTR